MAGGQHGHARDDVHKPDEQDGGVRPGLAQNKRRGARETDSAKEGDRPGRGVTQVLRAGRERDRNVE